MGMFEWPDGSSSTWIQERIDLLLRRVEMLEQKIKELEREVQILKFGAQGVPGQVRYGSKENAPPATEPGR
jgi:hypothetical protein